MCIHFILLNSLKWGPCRKKKLPQRGLRQGDPISPYLSILCAEVFSSLLSRVVEKRSLHGIQIARGAPILSRLFFAYDTLIFCRTTNQDANCVQSILTLYQDAYGQFVNLDKSKIYFFSSKRNPNKTSSSIHSNICYEMFPFTVRPM